MIVKTVLLSFFSVFIFSMPSKTIIIVIEFMFLGINMFWALLRLMSLSRAQNIFMPANINSIVILVQTKIASTPCAFHDNSRQLQENLLSDTSCPIGKLLLVSYFVMNFLRRISQYATAFEVCVNPA